VVQKIGTFVRLIISSNIDKVSNFVHCQNQEKIILSLKIAPHLKCVATLPCECQCLKSKIENKTSVTTHFKKLTTGNNVSVIV